MTGPDHRGACIRAASPEDHYLIVQHLPEWWDPAEPPRLHPLFLRLFSDSCFIAEGPSPLAGFLIGLFSTAQPALAYCHLIGIAPRLRSSGLGSSLYLRFVAECQAKGRTRIEAVARPDNRASISFHRSLGFQVVQGDASLDGLPVFSDFDGLGTVRCLLRLEIGAST